MRILCMSDHAVPTGYGRIAMEICSRLVAKGVQVYGASGVYDGLMPPSYEGQPLPYPVASLANKDWVRALTSLAEAIRPDVVLAIQDFPYMQVIQSSGIDWSDTKLAIITPVDGAPIAPEWITCMKRAAARMTISAFGVETFRQQGVEVTLVPPGVDPELFRPYSPAERADLRAKAGILSGAFVLGTACQNQGRKAIPLMLKAFDDFSRDKPDARYILDMEPTSPAGWNIPALCEEYGWDAGKLIFRRDLEARGLLTLRDRMNLMDAHIVLAHREGFGLPLIESQVTGAVAIALDYCSGFEITGDGRGILIPATDYVMYSAWGGAMDRLPNKAAIVDALNILYRQPDQRRAIALAGQRAAKARTWEAAAQIVYDQLLACTQPVDTPA